MQEGSDVQDKIADIWYDMYTKRDRAEEYISEDKIKSDLWLDKYTHYELENLILSPRYRWNVNEELIVSVMSPNFNFLSSWRADLSAVRYPVL